MNLEFGSKLKKLRRERDMTQEELARALSVSVQAISRYETGNAYPDIEMLPVIAGYFDTTIDELLGVSKQMREKRKSVYIETIRRMKDRAERLAVLRQQHAEFPEDWEVVSDMVFHMTFLPECMEEMRETVWNAMRNCEEPIWRENIILNYVRAEKEEEKALAFIETWAAKYETSKLELLKIHYDGKNEEAKRRVCQKILLKDLDKTMKQLASPDKNPELTIRNCSFVLAMIDSLTGETDRTVPDMWANQKLLYLLRFSGAYFENGQKEDGYAVLETAVSLFERIFTLPDGSTLSYKTSKLDLLTAKTKRSVYYGLTEFSGIIAESFMIDLTYEQPIAVRGEWDMGGLEGANIFAGHTYQVLKNAWLGFSLVKQEERYLRLTERVKFHSTLDAEGNILFALKEQAMRTDDYVDDVSEISLLYVKGVGGYVVFGQKAESGLSEKVERMKREGNTKVAAVATMKIGGELIFPPEYLLQELYKLNPENREMKVITAFVGK